MKKQKFTGKLSLNKETISKLQNEEMRKIEGGLTFFCLTVLVTRGCVPSVGQINTCDSLCPSHMCA